MFAVAFSVDDVAAAGLARGQPAGAAGWLTTQDYIDVQQRHATYDGAVHAVRAREKLVTNTQGWRWKRTPTCLYSEGDLSV